MPFKSVHKTSNLIIHAQQRWYTNLIGTAGPALSFLGPGVKPKIRGPSTYMLVTILYVRACLVHVRAMRCTLSATVLAHVWFTSELVA